MLIPNPTLLLIISGPPCSGKSTLARRLGRELSLPVIAKDTIKESLFDTLGWSDRERSKRFGTAAVALMFQHLEELLRCRVSCIIESTFRPEQDREALREMRAVYPFNALEIVCTSDPADLVKRFIDRDRHPGHADQESREEMIALLERGAVSPVGIGEVVSVNAFDPGQIESVVLPRIRALMEK